MFKHHPLFPRNPAPPPEAPGHLNLGVLHTGDDGCYIVPTLAYFKKYGYNASEEELDMMYTVVRNYRRSRLIKSVLMAIALAAFLSIPFCFLPHVDAGSWDF